MKFITLSLRVVTWQCLMLALLTIPNLGRAQSIPVYAQTISSQDHVDQPENSVDGNLSTKARVRANSGLVAGIGAYSGHLELQFPSVLPANTTSFVKIQTDDDILPVLLGGSLGNLLSDVLGVVLIGNQEITVQARNGGNIVLQGNSDVSGDFAGPRMRIVVNAAGEYFVAVTPSQSYDRIRLTNRLGSLVGLNNTKHLDVYGAFYIGTPESCGGASYTSYDGSGLTLDLLTLGGAGVSHPNYVLDANPNNFSRLSLGILGVAASVEQTVYFDGPSQSTDQFFVRMRIDPALLALGVANNIQIVASNGPSPVQTVNLNALLNVDLLALLQANQIVSIPFSPGAPVNRITVRYNALLNVQLTQTLDLYDIKRAPANPTITDAFSQNAHICAGSTASLIAQSTAGTELLWYMQPSGGSPVATTGSGSAFVTPSLTSDTDYYVSARKLNCPEESGRVRVHVFVIVLPLAADIAIPSVLSACNGNIVLAPVSSIGGAAIRYYKGQNKTIEITTGFSGDPGVSYTKDDATGTLSITGLSIGNSPYTYYISLTADGLCENAPGTLKAVTVNVASILDLQTAATLSGCGSVNLRDAILNFDSSGAVEYHFYDASNTEISPDDAAHITQSGSYSIQETGSGGSCASMLNTVDVTVNPIPSLDVAQTNVVVNLGASVTLDAVSDSPVTWFGPDGAALASNTYGPFAATGMFTFTAIADNGNCQRSATVTAVVIDPASCPPLTRRIYANSQSWGSIVTGGVTSAANAVDANPQTFSTITTGIGLLGVGTTWQTLQWTNTIAAGTPLTVKLGSQYSGLIVAGAYSVVGTKRNAGGVPVDIGFLQPVSGSLADLLPGENSFEFTFVPADNSGPKAYDGVRIVVGSLASIAQNVKVYDAWYDQTVSQVTCGQGDVRDVFSGAVDLGLGIATATVGVDNPWDAVDGNINTFASMYSTVGVLAAADLTVAFRTPTLTTDKLQIILSRPATVLDLSLIAGLTIQLYMGQAPVSAPIDVNSALISLVLIDGNQHARLTLQGQTVLYDRVKIRFGGLANVLDDIRVHEIIRVPDLSVVGGDDQNQLEACAGDTVSLSVAADGCTTYLWYDAAAGGNLLSTGTSYTLPADTPSGVHHFYVQAVRFGCEAFARAEVTVTVGETAPPTAITGISLNGGNNTTFCGPVDITLTAMPDATATITNPVFHWYDTDGTALTETGNTLVLTQLAPGDYTYSVGVSSDEYCETVPGDRASVALTILPSSHASDISVSDTTICQGGTAVLAPSSALANPLFSWYFSNDASQPVTSGTTAGITYTLNADGSLDIDGLTLAGSPYTYYVGMTSDVSCLNMAGDFHPVTVTVNDSGTPTTNDATQDFCQALQPTVADIQVNEPGVVWYDSATGGNLLAASTALTDGTTYYAGFAPTSGCGSAVRLEVTVSVHDAPTPTTTDDTQDFCASDMPTLADIQTNETGVIWYALADGGAALNTGDPLTDGVTYYGALVQDGCESSVRLAVSVSVSDPGTPTTNSDDQSFCLADAPTVSAIQANQPDVIWYDAATGGNALSPGAALTDGMVYYGGFSVPATGCESMERLAVTVHISDPGTPTTDNAMQQFCIIDQATVADIQVSGTGVIWYDAASGGNAVAPTTLLTDGATYYAANVDVTTGCESAVRLAVQLSVGDAPTPTTTSADQSFCATANATVADLQVNEAGVIWYDAPTGGTSYAATDMLTVGTYYAAQIVNGCESSVRLAVNVSFTTGGTPTTGNANPDFCSSNNPTLADVQVNESGIVWFDAPAGGNQLSADTAIADGTSYYASFDPTLGCASGTRLEITAHVTTLGTPTTGDDSQEFCASANPTVADLQVNETNVVWYTSATGGTPLTPGDALATGIYYAALTDSGCESTVRLAITVTLNGDGNATLTGGNATACAYETVTYMTDAGMSNYDWQVNNATIMAGGSASDNTVTVIWQSLGAGSVSVSYTNTCGGTDTAVADVSVITCSDITIAKTVDEPSPMVGQNVTFTITVNNVGTGFFYDVSVHELLPSGYTFVSALATDGNYDPLTGIWMIPQLAANKTATLTIVATVMGTGDYLNVAEIIGSDPIDGEVLNNHAEAETVPICLTVYNEFSPNGDGANDTLIIDCIESYPNNRLEVYNRYGSLVYQKAHYANDWNGTTNVAGVINAGDNLPAGTYYYKLSIDGMSTKTGWIAIAR